MPTPSTAEKIHRRRMKAADFELTHYADSRYPEVEPHHHEFYEILFFVSGNADYLIGSQIYSLLPGDILLIPPNTLHNPVFRDFQIPYDRFVFWFSPFLLEELLALEPELALFSSPHARTRCLLRLPAAQFSASCQAFAALEQAFLTRPPLWKADVKSFLLKLLADYARFLLTPSAPPSTAPGDTFFTQILTYIHQNLDSPLSLESLSAQFYLTPSALARMFKHFCQVPFYQYVLKHRLLFAKSLLLSGVSAAEAARLSGFPDYSSFYRAFRSHYQLTPSQIKKQSTPASPPPGTDA